MSGGTIQEFGSPDTILIRVERADGELKEIGTAIKDELVKNGFTGIIIERVEMVGPKVGKDLRMKALLSILYAIIGIVIYISWRFEFQYAIAAIIALIHDVLITMGAFSLLDKEFTLVIVAAFLTIIGYSLNDTIVVFDRIRENTRRKSKESLSDAINTSINQTLSRTLLNLRHHVAGGGRPVFSGRGNHPRLFVRLADRSGRRNLFVDLHRQRVSPLLGIPRPSQKSLTSGQAMSP